MKKSVGFPICVLVLGGLILLIPLAIFPACSSTLELASGGTTPMKCHWSAISCALLGAITACAGVVSFFLQTRREKAFVGVLLCFLGVGVVLLPTLFIGVCANATMRCHMAMQPALVVCGVLLILLGGGTALVNGIKNRQSR